MSRVQELPERQDLFDTKTAAVEEDPTSLDDNAHYFPETTCAGRPLMDEWADATIPARGTRKQITLLESLLEKSENVHTREALEEALNNLKAKPAPWVKQLKVQAEFEDNFEALKSTLEDVNGYVAIARARYGQPRIPVETALNMVKELHPVIDSYLDNLVVASCTHDNPKTPAYATAEQEEWLKNNRLLFKRAGFSTEKASISRTGSDYFHLLHHIDIAGVLEEQDFYNQPEESVVIDEEYAEWLEAFEAAKREHMSRLEPSNRYGTPSFPIDEYTVDIDETIVETD